MNFEDRMALQIVNLFLVGICSWLGIVLSVYFFLYLPFGFLAPTLIMVVGKKR